MEVRPDTLGLRLAATRGVPSSRSLSEARRREFRCLGCGFGAIVALPLARCPMCGGRTWQDIPQMAALDDAEFVRS
jgi:rubredoxin